MQNTNSKNAPSIFLVLFNKPPGKFTDVSNFKHAQILAIDNNKFEDLLKNGADPNEKVGFTDNTFLHILSLIHSSKTMVKAKVMSLIKILKKYNVDVNIKNSKDYAPIYYARGDMVQTLIDIGANEADRTIPLAPTPVIVEIPKKPEFIPTPENINEENSDGIFPLCLAENLQTIKKFIKVGADMCKTNPKIGSALHFYVADMTGEALTRALKYAFSIGAEKIINSTDSNGDTPFTLGLQRELQYAPGKAMDILLKNGADVHVIDKKGNTTLMKVIGTKEGRYKAEKVKMLLRMKVSPNIPNNNGDYPIMFARNFDMLKLFKNNGASLNVANRKDQNLLHIMAKNSCYAHDAIQYLIDKGININAIDKNGKTPLMTLLMKVKDVKYTENIYETFKILLKNTTNFEVVTKRGKSLMDILKNLGVEIINREEQDRIKELIRLDKLCGHIVKTDDTSFGY